MAAIAVLMRCEGPRWLRLALFRIGRVSRPSGACSLTCSRYGRVMGLGLQLASCAATNPGHVAGYAVATSISGPGDVRPAIALLAVSQNHSRAAREQVRKRPSCHCLARGSANAAVSVYGLISRRRSGRPMFACETPKGRSVAPSVDAS